MTLKKISRHATLGMAILFAIGHTPAYAGRAHFNGLVSDTAFDQFIVKYREGSSERSDSEFINRGLVRANQAALGAGRELDVRHFRRMSLGADVIRSNRKLNLVEAETLMRQIAADPNVEYVEVDVRMYPALIPNDPLYSQQPHYFNATTGINLPNAWDKSTGTGIVVAVIDTGSTPHSDLNANTVAGYDFITNTFVSRDGNGRDANPNDEGDWRVAANECYPGSTTSNSSWHGSHVAGTIGALTNNSNGVAGVAFGARLQHVRVLGRCGGSTSDIVDGIVWASGGAVSGVPVNANPARIINMSLGGGGGCSFTFQSAINTAVSLGSTVVVAAGNSNDNAGNYEPASCANVVTVGAINDTNGSRWSSSNFGAAVDIAAPGVNVLSTINSGSQSQGAEAYVRYNGTSMASPHVAGVGALMQSRRLALGLPLYTPSILEIKLKGTARPFPSPVDQPIGVGIVNANAAVDAASLPYTGPTEAHTGAWYNPAESGWGLTWFEYPNNGKLGLLFIYDSTGRADWYELAGTWTGTDVHSGNMRHNTGPAFGPTFDPALVVKTVVGTYSLNFSSTTNATLSFTMNGVTRTGIPLTKI
jgi:serine protease